MFENSLKRYNASKYYLASIKICYPDYSQLVPELQEGLHYETLLRRQNNEYIDIRNPNIKIIKKRNPKEVCYTIDYIEPFQTYTGHCKMSCFIALLKAKKYFDDIELKEQSFNLKRKK